MKHNFVAKNMNKFNRADIHKDVRRESIMDSQSSIDEGLEEYENYFRQQSIPNELLDHYQRLCVSLVGDDIQPVRPMEGDETNPVHIIWMINQIRDDKLTNHNQAHRWLGFIQGVLITKGLTTVTEERELTRPMFKGK